MKNLLTFIFLTLSFSSFGQAAKDEILQVGLTIANGYTGSSAAIISQDSVKFSLYKAAKQYEFDTLTSKELWESINSVSDLNLLSKIKSGNSNQDRDGTDTICLVITKSKNDYSFTNGCGKEFEEQKLLSILMIQSDMLCKKMENSQIKKKTADE